MGVMAFELVRFFVVLVVGVVLIVAIGDRFLNRGR